MQKISDTITKLKNSFSKIWSKTSTRDKTLFFAALAVFLIIIAAGVFFLIKSNSSVVETESLTSETEVLKQNVTLEAGDEFDITKILTDQDILDGDYTLKIYLIDAEGNETEVALISKYYDAEGNEVAKETAVTIDENGKESLNEGYTEKQFLPEVGKYKIVVTDKNGKKHDTIIIVKDTKAPVLVLKEVRITKGTAITVVDFVESCHDNSSKDCILAYVDEAGNEIAEITGEVGEHVIRIIAKDTSGNKTVVQEAKLVIEEPATAATSGGSGGGSGGGSSGAKSSTSTGGYSRSNPIANAALSLVGRTGMSCTDVAEYSLNAVGKSLAYTIEKPYPYVVNIFIGNEVTESHAYSDHSFVINSSQDKSQLTVINVKSLTSDYRVNIYFNIRAYVVNNIITRVEVDNFSDSYATHPSFAEPIAVALDQQIQKLSNYYVGQQAYVKKQATYSIELWDIRGAGTQIPLSSLQPGDILWWGVWNGRVSHIAVYVGSNQAVHGGWDSKYSVVVAGATSGVFPAARPAPTAWRVNY